MNFLFKSIVLFFVSTSVISLLILNGNWGKKHIAEKKKIEPVSEIRKAPKSIFVNLMDLKTSVIAEFEADFKKRKKIKLSNE